MNSFKKQLADECVVDQSATHAAVSPRCLGFKWKRMRWSCSDSICKWDGSDSFPQMQLLPRTVHGSHLGEGEVARGGWAVGSMVLKPDRVSLGQSPPGRPAARLAGCHCGLCARVRAGTAKGPFARFNWYIGGWEGSCCGLFL